MKFITEQDLRCLYKSQPFTSYDTEPGTRLTPGARQFLSDRGIRSDAGAGVLQKPDEKEGKGPPGGIQGDDDSRTGPRKNLVISRLKSIEALFLTVGAELLTRDVLLSQEVMKLHSQLSDMRKSLTSNPESAHDLTGPIPVNDLEPRECSGMCREDYKRELGDCFEITAFHVLSPKGAEIVALHRLRCSLRELNAWMEVWYPETEPNTEPETEETEPDTEPEKARGSREMKIKTNQIVNALSFLICLAFGGKTCQRKS